MSNQVQADYVSAQEFESNSEAPVERGDLTDIRPIPRISMQCFCETDIIAQTLEMTGRDRRMARTHVKVNMGGIPAAVEFYQTAPTPNLIMVESHKTNPALMEELGRLAEVCDPDTKVVVIGHHNDILIYRELISNGVSDYLVAPIAMADIMNTVSDIFVNPENGPIGRVVAFVGAKGGCGSSTICHNVAWAISTRYKVDTLIADMDLAFGTANINLDQDPPQGIAEAVFSSERVDDILLDRLLAKCAEHLNLLAAPSTLERTYDFQQEAFYPIIETAQRSSPHVVLDIPHMWTSWTRQTLAAADDVVITAEPELASLRNTKNMIDALAELRPNDSPPKLIINKAGISKRPEISIADFCRPLELEAAAVIPFDPELFGSAANNGQMIAETDSRSAIAGHFDFLAQVLTGKAELKVEKKGARGLMSLLRRGK
ncbi:MAG: AAA family ATPase [Nitratireductor sp.]|nr:CpaE family protein [Nitratireductor sp.]MCC0021655.1 AAA family ATPase [Nitratireductor sp.]